MTSATAGRAILFSGLTVIAGLTGMLFFENTGLPSLGWGGICATLVALTSSVILLPSILAILGDKINSGRVPLGLSTEVADDGFWSDLAKRVMSKPLSFLVPRACSPCGRSTFPPSRMGYYLLEGIEPR